MSHKPSTLRIAIRWLTALDSSLSVAKVAAKYQKKKEIPQAEGSGTTTVYEYSDRQIQHRNREKAKRIENLRQSVGKLRTQVTKDLTAADPEKRLTALAVALIDATYERVGNEDSAKEGHFGVTGWQVSHIRFSSGKATLSYVGKSGVDQKKTVTDSKIVKALKDATKGKEKDDTILCEGDDCRVTAQHVNDYLEPFKVTAKDLRGLHANEEMRSELKKARKGKLPEDKKERESKLKAEFKTALEAAAKAVGHESATLRSQYLVPGLEDAFLKDGTVPDRLDKTAERQPPLGPNTPLMEESGAKVKYRIRTSRDGIAVVVYYGRTKIGGMNAFVERYPEQGACGPDVWNLLHKYPQVEDQSRDRWKPEGEEERTNTRALAVYKAFITDETKWGLGIGKAMYTALMAEWFDRTGPFLFMPMACSGSGTSQMAHRVWASLAKRFPSSGEVVAVLKRPQLPAQMRTATKTRPEKEEEEDRRLLRRDPEKKPPRHDLRRREPKDPDEMDDPDKKQDRKDQSQNWKDGSLSNEWWDLQVRLAREFTKTEWETYVEKHPKADIKQHTIVDTKEEGAAKEESSEKPAKPVNEKPVKKKTPPESTEDTVAEAVRSMKERVQHLLGVDVDLPQDFQDNLEKHLKSLPEKSREAFSTAMGEEIANFKKEPDLSAGAIKEGREALLANFRKMTPAESGKALAQVFYAQQVTFNPLMLGGRKPSDDDHPATEEEKTKLEPHRRERSEQAYDYFKSMDKDERDAAVSSCNDALRDLDPESPRAREIQGIREGIALASIIRGEGSNEISEQFSHLAQVMSRVGEEKRLLGVVSDFTTPESQKAIRLGLSTMGDAELGDFVNPGGRSNSSLAPYAEALTAKKDNGDYKLSEEDRKDIRKMLEDAIIEDISFLDPLIGDYQEANGEKTTPESRAKVHRELVKTPFKPKGPILLETVEDSPESGASRQHEDRGSTEELKAALAAAAKERIPNAIKALEQKFQKTPETDSMAIAKAVREEGNTNALRQRRVPAKPKGQVSEAEKQRLEKKKEQEEAQKKKQKRKQQQKSKRRNRPKKKATGLEGYNFDPWSELELPR